MRITGIPTTGPAVKKHMSSKMARELIAKNQTMYHLWFLVYQRVLPQLHLQSRLHQFGANVLPGISLDMRYTRGESGMETLWSQTLKT